MFRKASRALFLVSAPAGEMNMHIVKEIGERLRIMAPKATIRNGDYPRERNIIDVNLILSGFNNLAKIKEYYKKSLQMIPEFEKRRLDRENSLKEMEDLGRGIPSLLD